MNLVSRNLAKAYGSTWALRDVNLEIRKGDCIALLGPNGAGKTTLLKLLSALLYPSMGEIEFNGEKLTQGNLRLRSAIGFLSPDGYLYEKLTATENLLFFTSLYGKENKLKEMGKVLERVGLGRWSSEYASSFSHGMKCRLSIAKWLLLEPELLLLDEPYGALDGSGVDVLDDFLRDLCAARGIVILATHNAQRALSVCSRALILDRGRIIFDEPKQDPWENFHRAYAAFLPRNQQC
ncbi:MAG: heme ABC exporter ATP-binding protein CcmA [Candidatus Binatia bacterium]|nr:heme ABC exporter ATP-binding protein CcmA [Candidatus Binatia bacterium]